MAVRILRSDAPAVAQVTRLSEPDSVGEIKLTILGSGKFLTFASWNATAVAAAWNACPYPEFKEARASVLGLDVLLTAVTAGRPFYVSATISGNQFGNEVQTITPVFVTDGTAVASWLGQATGSFDLMTATADDLKTLFEALAGGIVEEDELTWSGPVGGPWRVEFGGRYAEQNVPLITITTTDIEGGVTAQNEVQRLLPGTAGTGTQFAFRRSDTLQTSGTLTIPVTASQVHTAMSAISYETVCTGGPVGSAEAAVETEIPTTSGSYSTEGVQQPFGIVTACPIGLNPQDAGGVLWNGLQLFPVNQAQGATIASATLKLMCGASSQNIAGVTLRAAKVANASFPSTPAAAAGNTLTTASVTFDIPAVPSAGPIAAVEVDVTPIVQEIVNQGAWGAGHSILFYEITPPTTRLALYFAAGSGKLPTLTIVTGASPIDIEWTGDDAETDIPQLIIVPEGGYAGAPNVITIKDGHAARVAGVDVETAVAGGEAITIRDDQRSRGPNHFDDPLNWECDDGSFKVLDYGDSAFIESGRVDLLYGLNQRSGFIALTAPNKLRLIDVHHFWVGQAVRVITTGTLPGGLSAATTYFIVSIDGPYVQLATSIDGEPVTLTNAGTGNHVVGVKLALLEIQGRWSGKLGLPRTNAVGISYFEYRERYLGIWADRIKIGTGDGSGSSRMNIDTGTLPVSLQAIASGGQIESGVNAVLWRGTNEDNEIEALGADVGIAIFPEESASFDVLKQRGGTVTIGRNVTGNELDATSGSRKILGARIAGDIISN